jgi:hypothetical protein
LFVYCRNCCPDNFKASGAWAESSAAGVINQAIGGESVIEEKVLEKLATSDKATIVIERQSDGKMRVTSGS